MPLRVQWGKPKVLDSLDENTRLAHAKAGREVAAARKPGAGRAGAAGSGKAQARLTGQPQAEDFDKLAAVAPPPGGEDVQYASLAGE